MKAITADDVLTTLTSCAGEPERIPGSSELDDATFVDLGYDSLALIAAATGLEQQFGVRIPDGEVCGMTTIGQLVARANA